MILLPSGNFIYNKLSVFDAFVCPLSNVKYGAVPLIKLFVVADNACKSNEHGNNNSAVNDKGVEILDKDFNLGANVNNFEDFLDKIEICDNFGRFLCLKNLEYKFAKVGAACSYYVSITHYISPINFSV
ncbi:hypothetical protein A9G39_03420 [Gilliamella sp. Imp1-6]|nr:hypothetical protein A9G31_06940 [Gilliamella apicola]OCG68166.1 hypothetical protein A9G39_03420 [Gilliamella apicola]